MADKIPVEVEMSNEGELRFRKLTDAAIEFGNKGQASLDKFSGSFNSFIGNISSNAVTAAFKSLTNVALGFFQVLITDGIKAAQDQEDAIARMNQALAASGKYTPQASKDIQEYASALQQSTKYADENILSASALLQSLGRLDSDGLKKATKAAVDLASGMKIDLQTAALQVGTAIEGNAGRLAKLGLKLDDAAGSSENLAAVTALVASRFGGSAQSEVNTFSGAIERLKNNHGEYLEAVGNVIIKNQSLINVINVAQKYFLDQANAVDGNRASLQDLVSQGIIYVIEGARTMIPVIEAAAVTFLNIEKAARFAAGGLSATADALGFEGAGERAQATADRIYEIDRSIHKLETGSTILTDLDSNLYKLQKAAEAGLGKTADNADRSTQSIRNAAAATEELTKAQQKLVDKGVELAKQGAEKDPQVEYEAKQKALEAALDAQKITLQEFETARVAFVEERNKKISELETQAADATIAENQRLTQENLFSNLELIQANQAKLQTILLSENLSAKDRTKIQTAYTAQSKEIEKGRGQAIGDSLGALASLQTAKTKELAVLGKGAAIAQATIDTYRGASAAAAALAGIPFVGPALAAAAAAAFITAGVARVAQISGVQLATGITEVPSGYPNDTFPARLTSGERVVDAGTNEDLKGFLGGSGDMNRTLLAILNRLDRIENHTVVNIGNRTIVDEVRDGISSGRVLNV